MAEFSIIGIKELNIVDAQADGSFPSSWGDNFAVKEGELSLNIPPRDFTNLYCEQSGYPFSVAVGNVPDSTVEVAFCALDLEDAADIGDGVFTAAATGEQAMVEFKEDSSGFSNKAIRVLGIDSRTGEETSIEISNTRGSLGIVDTITKTDLISYRLTATILQPLGDGTESTVYRIKAGPVGV